MTISMTAKHQITIPKKIADALDLRKGSMFEITIYKNKIELIPLEIKRKAFTKEVYKKLDILSAREKGKEKRVTKRFIENLKSGKA
ncbi:MAG: AbrB/MazE/SpoVT family DNA-binding domain-containing protein [Candidatus Ancaeobacter aquaticus]|nr:AbrB/MazE/SpoVT family DNA-binding domain-containing protein [Candidatus Ancaeobacter aquaticus]